MKILVAFFVATTVCFPTVALAGLFGPSTYDECVLENMKGVGSDLAARAVVASCRSQFPVNKPAETTLLPTHLVKTMQPQYQQVGKALSVTIKNGNSDWVVTNVILKITFVPEPTRVPTRQNPFTNFVMDPINRELATSIFPNKTGQIDLEFTDGTQVEGVDLIEARGRQPTVIEKLRNRL